MKYMLDTDICIYIIKQRPITVLNKFSTLDTDDICISSVTMAELMFGAEKSQYPQKNIKALQKFITPLEIFPFDDNAAIHYGSVRASLEKQGIPIGPMDLMIAAHAKSLKSILVTNNHREFSRVTELTIENWVC